MRFTGALRRANLRWKKMVKVTMLEIPGTTQDNTNGIRGLLLEVIAGTYFVLGIKKRTISGASFCLCIDKPFVPAAAIEPARFDHRGINNPVAAPYLAVAESSCRSRAAVAPIAATRK